jgi:hypothetical protein
MDPPVPLRVPAGGSAGAAMPRPECVGCLLLLDGSVVLFFLFFSH